MTKIPKWLAAQIKDIEREALVREHGEEKADEILLSRELGDLTYEIDDEENSGLSEHLYGA